MSTDKPQDPGATFAETVTQWERTFNDYANQVMGTEGFSRAMNATQNLQLTWQRALSDLTARHLEAVNMPTRDDVLRLGETLRHVEQRLARIEMHLGIGAQDARDVPAPSRNRQPPPEYLEGQS